MGAVSLFDVFGDRLELVLHCRLGECQTYSGLATKGWDDGQQCLLQAAGNRKALSRWVRCCLALHVGFTYLLKKLTKPFAYELQVMV